MDQDAGGVGAALLLADLESCCLVALLGEELVDCVAFVETVGRGEENGGEVYYDVGLSERFGQSGKSEGMGPGEESCHAV